MSRKIFWSSVALIAAVVAITYAPAVRLNFYGDDYSFLEIAGRSSFSQYLAFYFDPRLQTGWYRPLQGMVYGIEYIFFGGNPVGYHIVNILVHLANCLLLWAIVWRVTRNARLALFAALIYAGLPLYGVSVFWPADADFQVTFFYLLTLLFWTLHLQSQRRAWHLAAFGAFLAALLSKEFGVTLPVMLVLFNQLVLREKIPAREWVRRYAPFFAVWIFYLPLEVSIQSRSVLTNLYGYGLGEHSLTNFLQYLAALAFPWGLPDPLNYIWLGVMVVALTLIVRVKQNAMLLFLGIASVIAFVPVINFPWFFTRYLYFAAMASAIVLARAIEWGTTAWGARRWVGPAAFAALGLIVVGNAWGVTNAVADFAELGRQTRVPFRDITQRHAGFPADTYLYFIDPPTLTSELSGMFFVRYGRDISVSSNETNGRRANLRDHANPLVIYFDEQKRTREIQVDSSAPASAASFDFVKPLRLKGYEVSGTHVKRGEALALILYWQATGALDQNFAVSVELKNSAEQIIAQNVGAPRAGKPPMTVWQPGEMIVDARVLSVASDVPIGDAFTLQIRLLDPTTWQPIPQRDGTAAARLATIRIE